MNVGRRMDSLPGYHTPKSRADGYTIDPLCELHPTERQRSARLRFSVYPIAHAKPPRPRQAGRGAQAPLAIPNPNYVTIPMEINVNRPAAEVWKRVGKYCDIGEWLQFACTIISGKDVKSAPCARSGMRSL